eukprot:366955_1
MSNSDEVHTQIQMNTLQTVISLQKLHTQQLLNGQNNNHNLSQLVDILGGIDSILNDYLSEMNNMQLSNDQLAQVGEILNSPPQLNTLTKLKRNTKVDETYIGSEYLCYLFHESNSWLRSLLGNVIGKKK